MMASSHASAVLALNDSDQKKTKVSLARDPAMQTSGPYGDALDALIPPAGEGRMQICSSAPFSSTLKH